MRERGIILTEGVVLGLFFVQRYRFLTIDQFARASGMHRDTASRQLRSLELRGVLSHFGNACLPGHGRTPKVYFLTLLDLMDSEYPFGLNIFECRDAADINEVAKTSKKDMGRAP